MTRQEILNHMRQKTYKPLKIEELLEVLPVENVQDFIDLLKEMETDGDIIRTKKNKFGLPEKMNLAVGFLQAHPQGYGFVISDRPEEEDVYVSAENINGAMHKDRVVVRLCAINVRKNKREGEVIRILSRSNKQLVGTFENSRHFGFVVPDDVRMVHDIFIPRTETGGAKDGEKVVVEITRWPEKRRNPEGIIIERLGSKDQPGVDILSIIRKHQLPEVFSKQVLREADMLPRQVLPEQKKNRRDLTGWNIVTIDSEDAKDLDDAVSIRRLNNGGYLLGVHIADVSYYVKENGELEREARERGTSVYLVDRVIPMLPTQLSNVICSLNAGEERLALSVLIQVDQLGNVENYEITESIIFVKARMSYKDINSILEEGNPQVTEQYPDFIHDFRAMEELSRTLYRRRLRRGAIDFEFPESKVIIDDRGAPVEIKRLERRVGEQMIEEFMLLANETVAQHLYYSGVPCMYRVHEEPKEDKLEDLNEFLHGLGYHIRKTNGAIHPRSFQEIIQKVKGRPEEPVVSMMCLRSMEHARYAPEPLGHFGLAAKYYAHFTAPIRRYPDLIVHRILREILVTGSLNKKRKEYYEALLPGHAETSSARELVAEEAERESVDLKKVEYMQRHLGDIFTGTVANVTSFGMFIALPNTVEGLLRLSDMEDDYYLFNEKQLSLTGSHTGKVYRIGDEIKVQVARVNIEERQIDFHLVEND